MLAMRLSRRRPARSWPDAARLIGIRDHCGKEMECGLFDRQFVSRAGKQKAAKPLMQEKVALAAQRQVKLKRLLPGVAGRECFDGFAEKLRKKGKDRAIVTTANRVRYPVAFVPVEKQHVVRIGHDFPTTPSFHKHARAHENDLVRFRIFFAATLATVRTAAHIRNGNRSAVMEPEDMKVR